MTNQRKQSQTLNDMPIEDLLEFPAKWKEYKAKFKKVYPNEEEETMRRKIFFERYTIVEIHNKKFKKNEVTFRIMTTELSDRTPDEIDLYYKRNAKSTLSLVAHMGAVEDESGLLDEEWKKYKIRTKKRFSHASAEEISKLFFLAKFKEIGQVTREFKKDGLIVDMRDVDQLCHYSDKGGIQTTLEDQTVLRRISDSEHKKQQKKRQSQLLLLE